MARSLTLLSRVLSEHGMAVVLLLLCIFFSAVTLGQQYTPGAAGGETLAAEVLKEHGNNVKVAIAAGNSLADGPFLSALAEKLEAAGATVVVRAKGHPYEVREALEGAAKRSVKPDVIAASHAAGRWTLFDTIGEKIPQWKGVPIVRPRTYIWPNFLTRTNLLNIANQIAIIAIIAIGMTLVIISGGIDLSVGSLIALSAVIAALLIRDFGGGEKATSVSMLLCCFGAIGACALVGFVSGATVTWFDIPPFIATLSMMLIARGLASTLAESQSIYQIPPSFTWLGLGADLAGIPNAVVLMVFLYAVAQIVMSRMTPGRYIYAVGGNPEAARLAGVNVRRVRLLVYTICGALAGVGGVIMASQFKSGAPTYGKMYELYVIAAVVVGGTSLSGGEGKLFGTLIGALIIAVIWNGMNLTNIRSETQDIVLGGIILGAVLLDRIKKRVRR
jgi:ribose transport system permease protein